MLLCNNWLSIRLIPRLSQLFSVCNATYNYIESINGVDAHNCVSVTMECCSYM